MSVDCWHSERTQPKMVLLNYLVCLILLTISTKLGEASRGKRRERLKMKEVAIALSKGLQCYNCMSLDHPGCWDPEHPEYSNITVPNIDCYIPGVQFACIVITAEAARLVDTRQEMGPVRARTCVPAKEFKARRTVSYDMCGRLAKELASSEVFSRVHVSRPKCTLCKRPLCVDSD